MTTNIRDPRTIITPDAFEVSDALLGMPLAAPSARFWAIIIDLIVISLLTVATDSISLIIWAIVGAFFLQMAFRKPSRKMNQITSALFRGATGCLGLLILFGVSIGFIAVRYGGDDDSRPGQSAGENVAVDLAGLPTDGSASLSDVIAAAGAGIGVAGLANEDDPEVAEDILRGALDSAYRFSDDDLDVRDFLSAMVDEDSEFTDAPDAFIEAVASRWESDNGLASPAAPDESEDLAAARATVADLSPGEVLAEWAALGDPDDFDATAPRAVALRSRAIELVAADSIAALDEVADDLRRDLSRTRGSLATANAIIDENNSGFTALVRDIWEQLGSAFGLWSIYFTVMLTLFKGQTVGKKVLGIRVLRLDGEPITWWAAFERGGGYFAGIATGLLGFAQVYWDANRQCVHDKIGGTVVVLAGGEASDAWREAGVQPDPFSSPRKPV